MAEVRIPVETVLINSSEVRGGGAGPSTSSHHHTSTFDSNSSSTGESSPNMDAELKRMEAEMERLRREMEQNTGTSNAGSNSATDKKAASSKMHSSSSYHKSTKTTETKKVEQPGTTTTRIVQEHHVPSQSGNYPTTTVRTSSPTSSNMEEIYRGNLGPGATITIKTSTSRDSTPVRKVVVLDESGREIPRGPSPHSNVREIHIGTEYQHEPPQAPPRSSTPIQTVYETSPRTGGGETIKKLSSYKSSKKTTTTTTSSSTGGSGPAAPPPSHQQESHHFTNLDERPLSTSSPVPPSSDQWINRQQSESRVTETDPHTGRKVMKLRYEISPNDYDASDINVKVTRDNKVVIRAEHKENTGGKSVWRECSKEFSIPESVYLDSISSSYNPGQGLLTVNVPLP